MVTQPGFISSRRIATSIVALTLAVACRGSAPAAPPATAHAPEPTATTAPPPLPASPTPPPGEEPAPEPTLVPGQETGFHGLTVPDGWFHLAVDDGDVSAVVFTPLDPAALTTFDDPVWMVPPDFTIAALARSPLPPGTDPAALQAGMAQSIESLSDADLESLLAGADRIGILDLSALASVTLTGAELSALGGRPSIAIHGEANFGPDREPALRILIHLTWTEAAFFTFYGITSAAAWERVQLPLNQSLESIELP